MANLYYGEGLAPEAFAPGALVEIAGEEARHALRVARLRAGERILVGNGEGALGEGVVESAAKDRFAVRLDGATHATAPALTLTLVQALAKGDRDERAVEQATEFGIDRILPWEAERSVSRWSGRGSGPEKAEKGVEKWRRIAREASKQSLRARVPEVGTPVDLAELCEFAANSDHAVVVLHPRGERRLSEWAAGLRATEVSDVTLVVGPEGGLSDPELERLSAAGAVILLLGDTVLRTSSAGPAGIAVLNAALGRW
ncbi:16S rRNA (uracil(1498)-N(3))-methyltransferase [Leucobacter luti]|uniref:16S rRNA (uracil(1498)-N(3))-methyltransferase n=1 Tax=Leucobacter luti TaxID=340320 RepID=UPI003D050EC1